MSVLIRGMTMPKKEMILILFPDGKVATEEYEIGAKAKAVEVPPHGRLIDADAFSEEMKKRHKAASDWYDSVEDSEMLARAESTMMAFTECRLTLDATQTVIEAEDGAE